jgi:dephospho-CoA kinase
MSGKPLRIGITGGIGSGKTLVSKIFSLLNVPVYNADERAKLILHNDKMVVTKVKEAFGEEAYQNGILNSAYISQKVFNDPRKLEILNSIVHPQVGTDFKKWCDEFSERPYVLKEAALLYEAGSYKDLDKIIVVNAPENLRIKRVVKRDPQRTEESVKSIIAKQWPDDEKVRRADYVIMNDDKNMIIPQVIALHEKFISLR